MTDLDMPTGKDNGPIRLLRDVLIDRMRFTCEQGVDHPHLPGLCAALAELIVESPLDRRERVGREFRYLRQAVNGCIGAICVDGDALDHLFYRLLPPHLRAVLYPGR